MKTIEQKIQENKQAEIQNNKIPDTELLDILEKEWASNIQV
jgi:hypothetical protein